MDGVHSAACAGSSPLDGSFPGRREVGEKHASSTGDRPFDLKHDRVNNDVASLVHARSCIDSLMRSLILACRAPRHNQIAC